MPSFISIGSGVMATQRVEIHHLPFTSCIALYNSVGIYIRTRTNVLDFRMHLRLKWHYWWCEK